MAMNPDHMREAIRLAIENVKAGRGGPFGALVARGDEVIASATNLVTSTNDPTAHAEVLAIREACRRLGSFQLTDCDVYASCEPCPMCLGAIYWARPRHVYFACSRRDAAAVGFDDDHIYAELRAPLGDRTIAFTQALREEGLAAMEAWRETPDRTDY
jgi:tRNA(Arg) A34 adenosine deaminase TadA